MLKNKNYFKLSILIIVLSLVACTRSMSKSEQGWHPLPLPSQDVPLPTNTLNPSGTKYGLFFPASSANSPIYTPTPDAPHPVPTLRSETEQYVIRFGDTLGQIAVRYGVSMEEIIQANNISNPNILEIGQLLNIPAPNPSHIGSGYKIIPNSELVASPATIGFDVKKFIQSHNGYLAHYQEIFDERNLTGIQIVEEIAQNYSINPRLLLAILEYQSGWVTNPNPRTNTLEYPIGWFDPWRKGLYKQLSWTANELNRGYYLWRVNAVSSWTLTDGTFVPINSTINAGTVSIQYFFSKFFNRKDWDKAVNEDGIFTTYVNLFGNPFANTYEPIIPEELKQPPMQLPFEPGVTWSFTGGPHSGWGDGSAWAALDFAPPSEILGCFMSNEWVVAVSDGLTVRSKNGAVVQDLDGDGFEQTGWTVLYMHIEKRDSVKVGAYLHAGDRIGHPSCEGGFSTGTHLHLARRYNGEWISADQNIPINLDGWIASSAGNQYDGFLSRGNKSIEAWNGQLDSNSIHR